VVALQASRERQGGTEREKGRKEEEGKVILTPLPCKQTMMLKSSCTVMDLNSDVALTSTGKQRRRLRRAGRKPARVSGPEWTQ
jgi:hypothetical protein